MNHLLIEAAVEPTGVVEMLAPQPLAQAPAWATKVFLAGSIEMGRAIPWQSYLVKELRKAGASGVCVFNPRRDDWDSSWKQVIEDPQFREQVDWELAALDRSDVIIMYFDPATKSPISLLELGLHAASGKMLVCCPPGFYRKGNVDIVCEKYGIPVVESKEELAARLIAAVA